MRAPTSEKLESARDDLKVWAAEDPSRAWATREAVRQTGLAAVEPRDWADSMIEPLALHGVRDEEQFTLLDRFLGAHADALEPERRAVFEALGQTWCSLFEICSAKAGKGMTVKDLLSGQRVDIKERCAGGYRRGEIYFIHVYDNGRHLTQAAFPFQVPHVVQHDVVRAMRGTLPEGAVHPPAASTAAGFKALVDRLDEDWMGYESVFDIPEVERVLAILDARPDMESFEGTWHWADEDGSPLGFLMLEYNPFQLRLHTTRFEARPLCRSKLESILEGLARHVGDASALVVPEAPNRRDWAK